MSRASARRRSVAVALALSALAIGSLAPGSLAPGFLAPRSAAADPAAESRFFDELARRHYRRGRYDRALADFLRAHEAAPSPRLLYNVALSAALSGRRALAWTFFEEYLETDDPSEDRRAEAARRMEALSTELALVRVDTDPPGAALYVDRRDRGLHGRAPRTLALTEDGTVTVLAELDGHLPQRVEVEVVRGERREVTITLPARLGTLVVRAPVSGEVTLERDGEVQRVPVGDPVEVPVGRYAVRFAPDGHAPARGEAVVSEGQTARVELAPRRLPPPTGRVLVDSGGVEAVVSMDGRRVGVTPVGLDAVPVGAHEIVVEAEGRRPVTRTVTVEEGRAAYLDVTLVAR